MRLHHLDRIYFAVYNCIWEKVKKLETNAKGGAFENVVILFGRTHLCVDVMARHFEKLIISSFTVVGNRFCSYVATTSHEN